MASTETTETQKPTELTTTQPEKGPTDTLVDDLAKVDLQDQEPTSPLNEENPQLQPPRPLRIYSRVDVLLLSKSSLVKPPDGMPSLKDWFGDPNEQQLSSKKDGETSGSSTSTRDRRFRRDAEDGDAPVRPSFRSTLSQPSQMGNFRHQSLRTAERERDADRERQRDERDREGQERLRNLSDKYDRDRLALSSAASALRNKDRESAPHLSSNSSSRKKTGESSDDWRRGPEPPRSARDELRRERDRDRPRESSRPRREPSSTRRDRDRDDRDRPRRGDDRDDARRDKDDYSRRDRDEYYRRDWDDRDRDESYRDRDRYDYGRHGKDIDREDDDPRRWRDDGRRDERMAARRDREREGTRGWDRWEPSHDRDRVDDRDRDRSKRVTGRDRRTGDEPRDRDEKKEREKEKEPAWMETYVPTTPGGGILGAQTEGQLDGIQAWKKGMKEKEKKEREGEPVEQTKKSEELSETTAPSATPPAEGGMDEIQLFKLMMKREAARKETEIEHNGDVTPPISTSQPAENGATAPPKEQLVTDAPATSSSRSELPAHPLKSFMPSTSNNLAPSTADARLLSLIAPTSADGPNVNVAAAKPLTPGALDQSAQPGPRLFSNPPGIPVSNLVPDRSTVDLSGSMASNTTQFNPPVGSRLLALGSRSNLPSATAAPAPVKSFLPSDGITSPGNPLVATAVISPHAQKFNGMTPPPPGMGMGLQTPDLDSQFGTNARATPSERSIRSFSPFGQPAAQSAYADELQEAMRLAQSGEVLRRQAGMSPAERAGLGLGSDNSSPYIDLGRASPNFPGNAGPYELSGAGAAAKGSRFAKFFDAKHREPQAGPAMRKGPIGPGLIPTPPLQGQRGDPLSLAGMGAGVSDARTMDDLFAMLQNSAQQGHRVSPSVNQSGRVSAGGGPFGQSHIDLQAIQQQQFIQNARHDQLYDSRLDDRNFVPDGMVPGLRPAQRPRSREPSAVLFNEQADDIHFSVQRHPQQQRNLEQMYGGPAPGLYNQQAGLVRNGGPAALQQTQFRNTPAGLASQQTLLAGPSQRLPPGLANLGGRPPHDPAQFLNSQMGGLHGGLHPNAPAQQGFNNFAGSGVPGYNGNGGVRGPLPGGHQSALAVNQLGGLTPGGSIDLRGPNQLLGMGAGGLGGGGLRGGVGAGFNPQHVPTTQVQMQQMLLRQQQQQQQQQQQHIPPQMMSHMLPPHIQQQQPGLHSGNAQGAQDLMALLMGGHRE